MEEIKKVTLLLGICILFLSSSVSAVDEYNYVWNTTDWIPMLSTAEGKPRIDLNLLNITAGELEVSGLVTVGNLVTGFINTTHITDGTIGTIDLVSTLDVTNYTAGNQIVVSEHTISTMAIPQTNVVFSNKTNLPSDWDITNYTAKDANITVSEHKIGIDFTELGSWLDNLYCKLTGCTMTGELIVLSNVGIGTTSPQQPLNVIGDTNITGNFTSNFYGGEMWNYTGNTTAWEFAIAAEDVYYNMTGLQVGEVNGFTFTDATQILGGSYLTAEHSGLYDIDLSFSFHATASGSLFGFAVVKNFNVDDPMGRKCYTRRQASGGRVGNIGINCNMRLDVGDTVSFQLENEDGTDNIFVHTLNLDVDWERD